MVGLYTLPDLSGVSTRVLLRWMFQFLKPIKPLAFIACFYLAALVAAEITAQFQVKRVVDSIQKPLQMPASVPGFWAWVSSGDAQAVALRHGGLMLLAVTSVWAALRYFREVSSMKMSMEMVYYIREAVYDKLQRVGFGFHDVLSTGQLINRALTDLQNVRLFVQSSVLVSLEIFLAVGGYIAVLYLRSPWVALLALAPLPIWTLYILRFSRKVQPVIAAQMAADDRNVSIITENIAGVHVVKAFATEPQEIARYSAACDDYFATVLRRVRLLANFQPIIRAIAMASHLTLFMAAGILVIRGVLSAGDILLLGAAMGAILGRLQQVAVINEQYQNAMVSARRLYEVLMARPNVEQDPLAVPMPDGPGAIRFENVTFGYDPAKPVLKNVSFEIPGGSVVAIVGPTGTGKTTLINLLSRFYDPQQGRILIDGVDVRKIRLESLRTEISFVFQETYLFSDTVAANIAYSRPKVMARGGPGAEVRGEIEAASRLAQAHDFIEELPGGYDAILGERGSSLSGGQRQRLAIARAIFANPRILALDDATAAVDPETEDLIRRGMRAVMRERTTFVIAHRISTVKRADVVIVMEQGRITQVGKHADLMEQDGHYRDIAAAQLFGPGLEARNQEEMPSHMDRMQRPPPAVPAQAPREEDDL